MKCSPVTDAREREYGGADEIIKFASCYCLHIVQVILFQLTMIIVDDLVKIMMGDLDKLIQMEAFLTDRSDSRQEVCSRT